MPVMRPPRKGVTYSEALAAAYASAPEDEIVFDTIELLHPSFMDAGVNVSVRAVNDHTPLLATLEATAPMNPGVEVEFKPIGFRFVRPPETESANLPEVELQVDNVSRILVPYLDQAKESRVPITLIWRPYLLSDLSGPHMDPPLQLTLRSIGGDMSTMTARAGFTDLANRRFPASEYTAKKFPGLVAR